MFMDPKFKLKVDPKLPHHYIIGVTMKEMNTKNPGEMYLKYGPVHFINQDVENVQDAILLSQDKVFITTTSESCQIHNCQSLVMALIGMKMAAKANHATLHHFSSEYAIEENWFETFVKKANTNKVTKKKLMDAKIKV